MTTTASSRTAVEQDTSTLPFWKMHGTGNDFILAAVDSDASVDWPDLAKRMCDRHFGVGADGLILVLPSEVADRKMRIFNADGSESEMCGNGIRCFVKYALDDGRLEASDGRITIETGAGILRAEATFNADGRVETVRVGMGRPVFHPADLGASLDAEPPVTALPLEAAGDWLTLTLVSMGNPHVVAFLDGAPAEYDLHRVGPAVEHHPLFANRTNFEVVRVLDRERIEMRVWERGVGETLACGTGACAAVVASRLHGQVGDHVTVDVPGGTLLIEWDGISEVFLTGPAELVFTSEWSERKPHA